MYSASVYEFLACQNNLFPAVKPTTPVNEDCDINDWLAPRQRGVTGSIPASGFLNVPLQT